MQPRRAFTLYLLFSAWTVGAHAQLGTNSNEWRHYGGDAGGTKYAPHDQIDAANVGTLEEAWSWTSPDDAISGPASLAFEATPLMVDGVLYTSTSFNQVSAINAATGIEIWTYDPQSYLAGLPPTGNYRHRGVAYWEDGSDKRIFIGTADAWLIALDAATGLPINTFGTAGRVDLEVGIPRLGTARFGCTSPPMIVGDVVVVGSAIYDIPDGKEHPPGDVRGFDARTGALNWTFHTVPRDGEFGVDTWGNDPATDTPSWQFSGDNNVWAPMSADPELGYVYLPVGCPTNNYYGGHRPGDNLFGSSLVCLNATTGERVWHFQFVHHDVWDYDTPAPPNLMDIVVDGVPIKGVAQTTKMGYVFVFDRITGDPVWPIVEMAVPQTPKVASEILSPTQPMPTKPPPFSMQGVSESILLVDTTEFPNLHDDALAIINNYNYGVLYTPPTASPGTMLLPGVGGGANWGGAAVDPATGYFFMNSFGVVPVVVTLSGPSSGFDYVGNLGFTSGPSGFASPFQLPTNSVTAYDMNTGTIAWQVPNDGADGIRGVAGSMATASLLFYYVREDTNLRAFNKATGAIEATIDLATNLTGVPMSYMLDGKQYIAVATGKGGQTNEIIALRLPDTAFANVPDVIGMIEATAISTINGTTGLSYGATTYQYSLAVVSGNVISQTPSDAFALLNATVDIIVSLGSPATTLREGFAGYDTDVNSSLSYSETQSLSAELLQADFESLDLDYNSELSMTELLIAEFGSTLPATVYVSFSNAGAEDGLSPSTGFDTLLEGVSYVATDGDVIIASGSTTESIRLNRPASLIASGGTVTIGQP